MALFIIVEDELQDAREVFIAAMKDKYPGALEGLGAEGYEQEVPDEKIREILEGIGYRVFTGDELHRMHLDEGG